MKPFTIITQAGRGCPWCERAADMLDKLGLPYELRPLDKAELISLSEAQAWSTVPMVFHGDQFIGGYTETENYLPTLTEE